MVLSEISRFRSCRKDGSIIDASVNAHAVRDDNQDLLYFEGIVRDITQKKRVEELKIARDAADAANRAKSKFLAHITHELRTPLNAILGFSQLMSRSQGPSPGHLEFLDIIRRNGEHLLNIINDILDMSKIEAGQITLNKQDFDLEHLLDDMENMFRPKAERKGLQLIFDCAPEIPRHVHTDEIKLRQVMINLINNAIKFTDKGSVSVICYQLSAESDPLQWIAETKNRQFALKSGTPVPEFRRTSWKGYFKPLSKQKQERRRRKEGQVWDSPSATHLCSLWAVK